MPRIKIVRPGLQTSVQDGGRRGYEHLGIMVSGQLDDYAAAWANRLVGNPREAAVLEMTLLGPDIEVLDDGWASLTGADLGATVGHQGWPCGTSRLLKAGEHIRFTGVRRGARAYLGFAGGLTVPSVLGSRATDLVAGFGGHAGRALKAGDVLTYAGGAGRLWAAPVPTCLCREEIRILPGVRLDRFPESTWERLVSQVFRVSRHSDRVGIRLEGTPMSTEPLRADAVSEGLAIGSIEVPPSGELLILLKSRGSIGGYPTVAHVIQADWPVLAQLKPGDTVRLRAVSRQEAYDALRALEDELALDLAVPKDPGFNDDPGADPRRITVKAPMWSVIYVAKEPGEAPLIQLGQHVEEGQLLAILEVMKQFYELRSPASGTVTGLYFEDGAIVDEGRILVEINPE